MVKKTTTKKTAKAKVSTKKARVPKKQKVDYYPNRVSLFTATAAVLSLFLFAILATFQDGL